MTKQEKIRQIKYEMDRSFKKLDRIVNSTNLGDEIHIFLRIHNLKEYLKRKIADIESKFAQI